MASEQNAPHTKQKPGALLQPVLPKSGLVVSEKGGLTELLCKPKILPLKSASLKRLEALQAAAANPQQQHQTADQQRPGTGSFR